MMKRTAKLIGIVALCLSPSVSSAQRSHESDDGFLKEPPRVGEQFPEILVYDTRGKEVSTSSLRGHYTVLTFGCLT